MTKSQISALIFTIGLMVGIFALGQAIPQDRIREFIAQTGPYAPLLFMLFTLVTYIIAPIGGTPVMYIGYYLFGTNVVLLTAATAMIAYAVNFWIARRFGRPLVMQLVGSEGIGKIDEFTRNYGYPTLIALRVLQGGIHDFVSYAAGLSSMRFWPYFLISIASALPGTAIIYYLGLQTDSAEVFTLVTSAFTIGTTLLFFTLRSIKKRYSSSHTMADTAARSPSA